MKKRMVTATLLVCMLVPTLFVPELLTVFELLLLFAACMATLEILNMYSGNGHIYGKTVKILAVLSTVLLYFSMINYAREYLTFENNDQFRPSLDHSLIIRILNYFHLENFISPMTVLIAMFIFFFSIMTFTKKMQVADVGRIYMAIIYVGICVGSLTMLRHLGVRFVVYLFGITAFTDTFALVFGLAMGKHKMAPTISPKKTWEGAVGGTLVATILGFLIIFLYPYFSRFFHNGVTMEFFDGVFMYSNFSTVGKIFFALVISASISVCSQMGDLVASKLKRNYGIKDYSQIFPGHGGILDRFDSAFFASAIFVLFIICETKLYAPIIPIPQINTFLTGLI